MSAYTSVTVFFLLEEKNAEIPDLFTFFHTNLFIDNKLGHFILQIFSNAAGKPPAKLQMHIKCFWPKCNQCNQSGGGHQFKSNPHQQYPLHSPDIIPVGVLEKCPLEFNLHQEHPTEGSNVSLDGDKVHCPVILLTSFNTQDGVTQHGGIQNSRNTSLGSQTTTHGNRGIKDNQHQFNNNEEQDQCKPHWQRTSLSISLFLNMLNYIYIIVESVEYWICFE